MDGEEHGLASRAYLPSAETLRVGAQVRSSRAVLRPVRHVEVGCAHPSGAGVTAATVHITEDLNGWAIAQANPVVSRRSVWPLLSYLLTRCTRITFAWTCIASQGRQDFLSDEGRKVGGYWSVNTVIGCALLAGQNSRRCGGWNGDGTMQNEQNWQ